MPSQSLWEERGLNRSINRNSASDTTTNTVTTSCKTGESRNTPNLPRHADEYELHSSDRPRVFEWKVSKMNYSRFPVAALVTTMFAVAPAWAADGAKESTHDGKFVSVTDNTMKMTNKDGKEHTHALALEARFTCDGTACKAADLKAGMKIRVTTKAGDKKVVTHVEAIDKHTLFANTHDGKFVSLTDNKLTMTDSKRKEHSHMVAADATMTCDGKACTSEHLKVGMKIRVTTKPGETGMATHVEGIDKDANFAQMH